MTRRYSDQEARAIFERALGAEHAEGITEDELVAAAAEVGIARDAVVRAIGEVEQAQAERDARQAILQRRRRRLWNHLVPFIAVNLFLFALNFLLTPGFWWFLIVAMSWALGLFFHAWAALSSDVSDRALRAELRRPELRKKRAVQELFAREERERARLRKERLAQSTQAFGEAVEEGVAAVLGRLAHEVGARSGGGQPRRVPSDRVRVEAPEREEHEEPEPPADRTVRR